MPELPEVEVICRGLRPHLSGQRITAVVSSGKTLRHSVPVETLRQRLCGQRIMGVERRAKYLLLFCEDGHLLIIHLGMTGNLGLFPHTAPLKPHDHVGWQLENAMELRFNDIRRFGAIWLLTPEEAATRESGFFAATGLEPFSPLWTADHCLSRARSRQLPIKNFLMEGKVVAGIGNIYANEALFAAGIHPARPASSLKKRDWQRLIPIVCQILTEAIACGGSTISDFINANGESGYFQINFKVYGRKGQPCPQCGALIEKTQIGGRASYFCLHCQR